MRRWRGNEWAVLLTLSLGFFMTLLDLTIVNVAIPDMSAKLHASLDQIGWVINAYIIVLAVLLITAGRLGDLRGRRNIFAAGVALFAIASVTCGFSQNAGELIGARAVQGLGAALLLPQTMAIIIATFPAHRRGAALGIWGAVAGVAAIAGPTIGGMLVTWFGWRWIFFVNLPVGLIVLGLLAVGIVPAIGQGQRRAGQRQPLDLPGVVFASAGLVGVTFGLVEGQRYSWGRVWSFASIPLIIGAGVLLLAVFLLVQARRQDRYPLIPFELFRDRNFAPMQTIATRNVDPRMAGAASGVLNTMRQVGSALASAVVLAVLQSRLAATHSFVDAMKPTLAIPIGVMLAGALLCLAIKPLPQAVPAESVRVVAHGL
jgi:EmrB/QacA subfamily drug resistance transporter